MCMYSYFYPLVNLKNGKRKVLFDYPVEFSSRKDFDDLIDTKFRFKNPILQDSMYNIFKRDDVESFDKFIQIPCGECYQCKKERTQSWAFRILQEAKLYKYNYFLTLTYNDENCPKFLIKDEISKFNKKLKVYLNRKGVNSDFRFFGCGEYGSKTFRLCPHYHIIYFNLDIPDLEFIYSDKQGFLHFESKFLNSVWNKGFIDIGLVDVGSACYVAGYVTKKLEKGEKDEIYKKVGFQKEFIQMSRRPGIGSYYLDNACNLVKDGIYNDFINGSLFKIPKYFTDKIKLNELVDQESLCNYELRNQKLTWKIYNDSLLLADKGIDINEFNKKESDYKFKVAGKKIL